MTYFLILWSLLGPIFATASSQPPPLVQNVAPGEQKTLSLKPSIETVAPQALLIDATTGEILLEKEADTLMHPSSMTKMMTAYMVFQKLKKGDIQLDSTFPVSERAWRMGGSKMFVPLNGMISVSDLLKGIIIQSGNDACIVIAEGLSGNEENFAQEMTQTAKSLGAAKTVFRNASGWPDPEHQTTARDLTRLAQRLIQDFPEYYPMFKEKEYIFNKIRQGNRNPLLYKNLGCDGIKTGHSEAGGYGVVASVLQGDRRLILVINGLPSDKVRALESLKLMNWGLQTFQNYTLFKAGHLVDSIPVALGTESHVPVMPAETMVVTLPRSARKDLKVEVHYNAPLKAPIQAQQRVGKVVVTVPAQNRTIEFPLLAATSIEQAGFFKRIKDSFIYLILGRNA